VKTWADHGRPLPVAVVVSIFDDLCEALAFAPPGDDSVTSLDHVIIDHAGVARLTVRPRHPVRTVSGLLRDVLSSSGGEDQIPAAAWPLLGQGLADDPWVRPASTDVMQMLLREALGPPAARDEVIDSCAAIVREPGPRELPVGPLTEPPMDFELLVESVRPEPATEVMTPLPLPTAMPAPVLAMPPPPPLPRAASGPRLDVPSLIESAPPLRVASLPEDLDEVPSLLPRPVLRHEPPKRRPVSLPAAPAARIGSTSSPPIGESGMIRLPSDGRSGTWVLVGLTLATLFLVAWLLGIV